MRAIRKIEDGSPFSVTVEPNSPRLTRLRDQWVATGLSGRFIEPIALFADFRGELDLCRFLLQHFGFKLLTPQTAVTLLL